MQTAQKKLDDIDRFLVHDVGVPAKWIHEARVRSGSHASHAERDCLQATRALYDRVPEVAVLHLLKACNATPCLICSERFRS